VVVCIHSRKTQQDSFIIPICFAKWQIIDNHHCK